ncbi:MAG: hemolysin [Bacteroidetes bacterium 4572_112]|nr:MAG: hemolysin [Bacteroidetes bacterium 4572_112]
MSTIVIIILVSIFFSALFSGIEIAFVSANKLKIELDKSRNKISGKILSWFNLRESKFIAMLLLGNNIALVVYGMYMEEYLNPKLFAILPEFMHGNLVILLANTIISTIIILIFAEFIPKATFRLMANRIMEIFSVPLVVIYYIMSPIATAFIKISEFILHNIFGADISNQTYRFSTIDFDNYIEEFKGSEDNETEEIDSDLQIFQNAIDFKTTKIRECMEPRTEIKAVEKGNSIEELKEAYRESGHSKIIVYEDDIDNIIGYVHAYDLVNNPKSIESILRNIDFIPETMPANKMLNKMLNKNSSIAIVLDEFGGTAGMVTMEDLIEEIFGEIEDEFDKEELVESQIEDNIYILSTRLEIDYLNEKYNFNFPISEEYETLGGLITTVHENIPQNGEVVIFQNYSFEIIKASNAKVETVRLSLL